MNRLNCFAAALALTMALPAQAADFSDPTWPCVQRKVENLSIGLMWTYPMPEDLTLDSAQRSGAQDLAERLSLRRIALEDLEPQVQGFAETNGGDSAVLGAVFEQVFTRLNNRRTRIISGIGDFSLSQLALAEDIDATRVEMAQLLEADSPDYDRVDQLEEKLDWDQLIYSDRQQSIVYLCETPVLLEKRLYAIAQLLARYADDG